MRDMTCVHATCIVRPLLQKITFPQHGRGPLHLASYYGRLDTVKVLTEHGASFSLCDMVSVFTVLWLYK